MELQVSNEKEDILEELSCDVIDFETFEQETKDENHHLSVDVEVFVGKDLNEDFQKAAETLGEVFVARTTKRGTRFYAGDINYDPKSGLVTFKAGTVVPDYFVERFNFLKKGKIGTTFADFCFLSADGTKFHTKDQSSTPFREDSTPGDLTWVLPSKFVDDMVEMMSIMNNLILGGTMQEAILYGPELN